MKGRIDQKRDSAAVKGSIALRLLTVVSVISVVVLGSFVSAIILGYVVVLHKQPTQKVALSPNICGNDNISSYKGVFFADNEDDGGAASAKDFSVLATSIKAKSDNENDPICQYILWNYAYNTGDKEALNQYLDNLTRLNNAGVYVDWRLPNVINLDDLKAMTEHYGSAVDGDG